jgi:hypothetical protein
MTNDVMSQSLSCPIIPSLKRLGYHRLSLRDRGMVESVAYRWNRRIRGIRRRHNVQINPDFIEPTNAEHVCCGRTFHQK